MAQPPILGSDLTVIQGASILASLISDKSGKTVNTLTNTQDFVTVAQGLLKNGYDPMLNSLSQMMVETLFSVTPYTAQFPELRKTNMQYGNARRKIIFGDTGLEDDDSNPTKFGAMNDGDSLDQYKIKKHQVKQLNFYGQRTFQKELTFWKDQLNVALSSPVELSSYYANMVLNASNEIEQAHDAETTATIINMIGGRIAEDSAGTGNGSVIHLLTEYNTEQGLTLTVADLRKEEHYKPFIQFAYARIKTISDNMTSRTTLYHTSVTGLDYKRHTPKQQQRLYMLNSEKNRIDSAVMTNTFHSENMPDIGVIRTVNCWQSIKDPSSVNANVSYMKPDATLLSATVSKNNIFAFLYDDGVGGAGSMGINVNNYSIDVTPFNARGKYYNQYYHFTDSSWNDFSENSIVFLLD